MKKWLYYGLIVLFSAIFLFSAVMLILYFAESDKQEKVYTELSQIHESAVDEAPPIPVDEAGIPHPEDIRVTVNDPNGNPISILPEFVQLYSLNPHIVGWITIPGTKLDYPVMQTPESADYYLKRNFNRENSSHGCIYAREVCDILKPSDNITLYGHRMKDGSMFAPLSDYEDKAFWEDHSIIEFSTLQDRYRYEVFAVFVTTASEGQGFRYHTFVDAANQTDFDSFVRTCKGLALYDTGITPTYGDKLITLSTCEYTNTNGRLVVVARRIDN